MISLSCIIPPKPMISVVLIPWTLVQLEPVRLECLSSRLETVEVRMTLLKRKRTSKIKTGDGGP